MAEVTYEIREHIAVLSDRGKGWRKEINLVSWNGGMPKLDIREWNQDHSAMKKGITLTRRELKILLASVKEIDEETIAEGSYVRSDEQEQRGSGAEQKDDRKEDSVS